MQRDQPIQADNLILSQIAPQKEWDLSLDLSTLKSETSRSKCFCHFDGKLSHASHLFVGLTIRKLKVFSSLVLLWAFFFIHALLHKTVGVELLSYFYT